MYDVRAPYPIKLSRQWLRTYGTQNYFSHDGAITRLLLRSKAFGRGCLQKSFPGNGCYPNFGFKRYLFYVAISNLRGSLLAGTLGRHNGSEYWKGTQRVMLRADKVANIKA